MDPQNKQDLKKTILKVTAILGGIAFLGFAVIRISKPLLLGMAHYIVRVFEKPNEDAYRMREVSVETEIVKSVTMPKYINTVGELKADKSVILHSETSGRIAKVQFEEGTFVKADDLLIKFDDDQAQAELKYRQARLEMADVEFNRQKKMQEGGVGKGQDYDKAVAELNMAKSEVEVAQANLRKTEIRAPFEGIIGLIDVGQGSFVQPNQELVTLVDQTPIKVKFGVPGKFINEVGVGQEVELRVESCKGRVFRGTVEAVDSHVDSATNSISLRASISNEDGALKAGLYADVMLVIGEQGNTITVDESAVERTGEQEYVWVVENNKARRVGVMTGARSKGRIEIIAGLKENQVVVVAGQLRLYEGAWVKTLNPSEEESQEGVVEDVDSL